MFLVKISFAHLDKALFTKLVKSIVCPHLEYVNVIWHPAYERQEAKIENVQRRTTKVLQECKECSYTKRVKVLDLTSIKYRQLIADLVQTYKILPEIDNVTKMIFLKILKLT